MCAQVLINRLAAVGSVVQSRQRWGFRYWVPKRYEVEGMAEGGFPVV